ncbi:MAG: TonB-dependent receptor [Gemmatimonadota bacterium]|nr:TonB-dependent receptor [Gemmatimonadota bacterium]
MTRRYSIITRVLALLLTAITSPALSAQTGTIVGTVTDAQSGGAVTGAVLVLEGTDHSGLSRNDGRFVLDAVPAGDGVVGVERIGYRPVRREVSVPADGTVVVDFVLTPAPFSLDELVVTGAAGSRRRRELGNTVSRLEIDEVTDRPATLSDFLQGAAVGIEVTGASGEAGQGKQIRLRGSGSMLLSSQPLVYIDGIRMMEGAFPSEVFEDPSANLLPSGANVTTSPLDLVSVGDIDRIEVAKGAAATTLFGTGSANGVIQIFTKRGVSGPPRWTADISQGTGWVQPFGANGVDYLHVEHFLRDAWWGGGYDGGEGSRDCVTDDPRWDDANASAEGACSWPGAQWYQRYRLAVDGGTERFDYFVSGEYQDDSYALPLDELQRYAFRTNLGATLTPRIETRLNASFTDFRTSNTASGGTFEGILLSTMRQERNYLSSPDPRDIADLLGNRNDQWIDRLTAGLSTTFSQSARASHRLTLGYDYSVQDLRSVHDGGIIANGAATTRAWDRHLRTVDYLGSLGLRAGPELSATLSFGAQLVSDDLGWTVVSGTGFPEGVPTEPADAESVDTLDAGGGTTTAGLFAQNVLGLRDRYFLTTGLRVDRHATQGESFLRLDPRAGLAWVASEEDFWPESLGALRLRAAYGHSSTAPSPFVQAVRYFGGPAPEDAEPGAVPEPESSAEWEVGLDATVLGERVNLGLTRYVQTTTNALVPVTVDPEATPERRELRSIGELRNQGWEVELDASVVSTPDWALDVGLGFGTNDSEVLDLGGTERFNEQVTQFLVGYPAPVARGRRVADPDAVNGPWSPDRYRTDASGNTRLPLGSQLPTRFVIPSLTARVPGGIVVSARGEYRGGHVRFVNPVPVSRSVRSPLCEPWYANPVDPEDPFAPLELRADTPDLWRERCTPQAANDYWFDADYFKLRSASATVPVGFAFPDRVTEALFTVSLANAFTWYEDVPWWDVEIPGNEGANDDGVGTSERVPAPTRLTFSLRMRF